MAQTFVSVVAHFFVVVGGSKIHDRLAHFFIDIYTKRAHETGRIYEADLEDIQQNQERIWTAAEQIVSALAALK